MGRAFALSQFFTVWEGLFAFLDAQDEVFTELFVKGSREKKDLKFIIPDPDMYPHWWAIQHQRLQFQAKDPGATPWMPGLL
ncbi:hypothetical protein [Massilia sp.]|uniref:hypothetical protein n=1 Tax=Massilia sp. TaxID=1882437 RepID=UPI0028A07C23|nr:hypothetical protein [Massilia sp.]